MFKDKISPGLKKRFLEEIQNTKEKGKELGFHICIAKDGNLFASDTYEDIHLTRLSMNFCPKMTEGYFHTYPYLANIKMDLKRTHQNMPSNEDLKKLIDIARNEYKGIMMDAETISSPTHLDLSIALMSRYRGLTKGTICIGTDIEDYIIECWVASDQILTEDNYMRAKEEYALEVLKEEIQPPLIWITKFFHKEIIDLNNI